MRPVQQTEIEAGRGNCLAACVASILELGIDEVPNFRLAADPWLALQEWLVARRLFAIRIPAIVESIHPTPAAHCILTGRSPRRDVLHSVVAIWDGVNTRIVHDPHPDRTGLSGPVQFVTFFCQLT